MLQSISSASTWTNIWACLLLSVCLFHFLKHKGAAHFFYCYQFAFFISSNIKVLHAASAMTIGISVGVYYQWRLGLVGVVMFPIMVASTVINQKIVNGVSSVEREAFEKSAKVEEFS